jgi:predicted RNA-binding Zn ribbon-like protein
VDPQKPPAPFELSGGAVCLDFANTLGDRPQATQEKLHGMNDLLRFAEQAGTVNRTERVRLERLAAARPRAARNAFDQAIRFREAVYRVFSTLAAGGRPAPADLEALNRTVGPALGKLRIEARDDGFAWTWSAPGPGFDHVLWPVARSAAELLTSSEAVRIRECAGTSCGWLFVDRSRTQRRRWCDMNVCGNRAKARRHYERSKRGKPARRSSTRS